MIPADSLPSESAFFVTKHSPFDPWKHRIVHAKQKFAHLCD